MSKIKKIVIISSSLLALGIILMLIGLSLGGAISSISVSSEGVKIYTVKAEREAKETFKEDRVSLESFQSIKVDMSLGNLTIQESDQAELYYKIDDRYYFSYKIEGDCLKIEQKRSAQNEIILFETGFNSAGSEIILSIPRGMNISKIDANLDRVQTSFDGMNVSALDLSLSFGNLKLRNSNLGVVTLNTDSVNINVDNISCQSVSLSNDFGCLEGKGLFVEEEAEFRMDSCSIKLEDAECNSLYCKNSFGSIDMQNIIAPTMTMDLDSTNIEAKELTSSKIEMDVQFGDIILELTDDIQKYGYDVETQFGKIQIGDKEVGDSYTTPFEKKQERYINISCDSGNVKLK